MKVEFKLIENIPNGFKCAGCSRLKKIKSPISGKTEYYCELNGYWCELGLDGDVIKTDDCLMQTRKYLTREGLK